jgi:RNA polymerase sigma-70 factor, ECF subfamily
MALEDRMGVDHGGMDRGESGAPRDDQAAHQRSPGEQVRQRQAREAVLAALIARAAKGDQLALAALYDETSGLVYGLAWRILHDQQAAEDVTLDVYVQVYRQVASYDATRGTPSAWLLTLTRCRAIDRLRQETHRRVREQPLEAMRLPSLTVGPEACSATTELRCLVQQALARLTPEQRQVIDLAYYAGLSHTEIAAHLGQPLGTVKTRLRTGLMQLRESLRALRTEVHP